jgi:hypothetical protein
VPTPPTAFHTRTRHATPGQRSTSRDHPRTAFGRVLERGNLVAAELSAREVGNIDLREALGSASGFPCLV